MVKWLWAVKGLLLAGALAATLFAATPANATVTACVAAVTHFVETHADAYERAGAPTIVCASAPNGNLGGTHNDGAIVIYPARGIATAEDYYRSVIAHEVGHAYFRFLGKARVGAYAVIRGFSTINMDLYEDYAETFALSIGEWRPVGSPAPFAFQTAAGVPTERQLASLRQWGIAP